MKLSGLSLALIVSSIDYCTTYGLHVNENKLNGLRSRRSPATNKSADSVKDSVICDQMNRTSAEFKEQCQVSVGWNKNAKLQRKNNTQFFANLTVFPFVAIFAFIIFMCLKSGEWMREDIAMSDLKEDIEYVGGQKGIALGLFQVHKKTRTNLGWQPPKLEQPLINSNVKGGHSHTTQTNVQNENDSDNDNSKDALPTQNLLPRPTSLRKSLSTSLDVQVEFHNCMSGSSLKKSKSVNLFINPKAAKRFSKCRHYKSSLDIGPYIDKSTAESCLKRISKSEEEIGSTICKLPRPISNRPQPDDDDDAIYLTVPSHALEKQRHSSEDSGFMSPKKTNSPNDKQMDKIVAFDSSKITFKKENIQQQNKQQANENSYKEIVINDV